jgi:hypothetical protein
MTVDHLRDADQSENHVTLYVRADPPAPARRDDVVDRVDGLESDDHIGSYSVETWGSRIDLRSEADPAVRAYETFERWADRQDVQLRPSFAVHEGQNMLGESYEMLVTPAVCLTVGDPETGTVAGVFPHSDDGRLVTVDAALSAIADEESGAEHSPEAVVDA